MPIRVPRRLVAPLVLVCVLAGCKQSRERSLSLAEIVNANQSAGGTRVRTSAIATYSDPEWQVLFVQDESVGMYITSPANSPDVQAGDRLQIVGNISPGKELEKSALSIITHNNPLPQALTVENYSLLPAFFSRFVEVKGVVRWAGLRDSRPVAELYSGQSGLLVYFRQGLAEDLPTVGSEVTVSGVAAANFDSNGKFLGPKLFSPSAQHIKVLKAGPADPFSLPLKHLSELKNLPVGALVHISGEIRADGKTPAVTDRTVTVPLDFVESMPPISGASDIEGFWTGEAVVDAVARPLSNHLARNGDIVHLADLKHLSVDAASVRRAVSVRAVVTYADVAWGLLFVQDETAAAYVDAHGLDIRLHPGDLVDIAGVSGPGGYAPQIDQPTVGFVRRGQLPQPIKIDLPQENLAAADSRWCTFSGVVRNAREEYGRTILEIGAGQSELRVQLPMPIHTERLIDREVLVTGVLGVLFNERRQAIGHQIFVPSPQFLKVVDSGTRQTDPVTIVSLQRYSPNTDQRHRVTLNGTVVLKNDANTIFVEDKTAGIQVRADGPLQASDGDNVSVMGFVSIGDYSPVLEHAVITSRSSGSVPKPYRISAKSAFEGNYDSEYVAMRANLVDVRSSPDGAILVLNDKGIYFEAMGPASSKLSLLRAGSDLELRGVCRVSMDRTRLAIRSFNLAFDSPQSVSIVRMGAWWDTRKVTWVLAVILTIATLASLWIVLLRQKVDVKTRELQSSVEAKRKAQQFDVARNQVLEAIARNAPPPESMEHLALAVQDQIEGSVCAIAMSPDGKSFLNGKPSAVLTAPNLPEDLQRQILPVLSSVLVSPGEAAEGLRNDTDVMASVLETARRGGLDFCDGEIVVAFSGAGELAGLLIVFFADISPADVDNATRVLQSASRLVSLARDHWHMHERLIFDARHDALTGLPNRTVAEDRLEQALARAERRRQTFAVLCIDLDGFKGVNDRLGHHSGDELLRVVATRLRARIRHSDTLARIGGDEFFAIIEDCAGDSAAQSVAESLVATLQEPTNLEGTTVTISGSIGIAMYPADGRHAAELKRNADQAMYRAKAKGRGKICFWSGEPLQTTRAVNTSSASD